MAAETVADRDRIATGYRRFAAVEAAEASPLYARLALAVTDDPEVLDFLADLPAGPEDLRREVLEDGDRWRTTMLTRATQTNEAARCAALLPLLAPLDGPVALIEVGASAGLCLYPDRYSYDYDGERVGSPSPVHLRCTTTGGVPSPTTGSPDSTPPPRSPPVSRRGC